MYIQFLGNNIIPRNKRCEFHGKFEMGIPICNNTGSKNLEIPRNSFLIANRTLNCERRGYLQLNKNDFFKLKSYCNCNNELEESYPKLQT